MTLALRSSSEFIPGISSTGEVVLYFFSTLLIAYIFMLVFQMYVKSSVDQLAALDAQRKTYPFMNPSSDQNDPAFRDDYTFDNYEGEDFRCIIS